jgi:hypothetical protein
MNQKKSDISPVVKDILWENWGSPITVIAFAGMDVRFGGMPRFEFQKLFSRLENKYNLIFVRDVQRSGYYLTPQGKKDGLSYYQEAIQKAFSHLPPSFNVTFGLSGGGMAPFLLSNRLPIHKIIAFNPCFPPELYASENLFRLFIRFPLLLSDPYSYFESFLVMLSARGMWNRLCRLVERKDILDPLQCYLSTLPEPPPASIYFSQYHPPDFKQAMRIKGIPSITLKPVNTDRHICLRLLKKRGELMPLLHDEIDGGYAAWINSTLGRNDVQCLPNTLNHGCISL